MRVTYINKNFSSASLEMIETANNIIDEYSEQGFDLTLRQLYYQMVSRDIIANKQSEYKRLGSIINDARLAGMIDWLAIVDRTRHLRGGVFTTTPEDSLASLAEFYEINKWDDQPIHVEIWIEKDALVGVIEGVCDKLGVEYFSCRGYTSQSEMWRAGQRILISKQIKKCTRIFHLGDHDPSGIDMTRDISDRLSTFCECDKNDHENIFKIERIALNHDQVEFYDPPPNPTKLTDTRATDYVKKFGYSCWELDALEPQVIVNLIERKVKGLIDPEEWSKSISREIEEKNVLQRFSDEFESINEFLDRW